MPPGSAALSPGNGGAEEGETTAGLHGTRGETEELGLEERREM